MSFEIEGLDELQEQFEQMENAAENLSGKYSFNELFPPEFMGEYTDCASIDEFLDNCGFPANNNEEFKAIPDVEFDVYVNEVTDFSSWEEMLQTATTELIARNLGF